MGIASKLYRLSKNGDEEEVEYNIYRHRTGSMETRHGARFDWIGPGLGLHKGAHYTSITMCSDTCAIMHSKTPRPQETVLIATFLEVLLLYRNPGLWENLSFDDDGEWIWQSMEQGSLVIAHNSSYMPKESTEHCLAGVIMYCSTSKKWLRSSIVECSNAASNYRVELFGSVMALLILRAATEKSCRPYPLQTLYCDNRGVIQHSNTPRIALTEKQKQANLIRLIKRLSSSNKCTTKWEWVEGHSVERKGWRNCSKSERLNHQADKVAKNALISGLSGGSTKEGDFPFKTNPPQACRHKVIWTNPPSSGSGLGVLSGQGTV
jgi:hypothetical protein